LKIFFDFDNSGKHLNIKNPVVTTGSFDGVHVGHKAIIDNLRNSAKKINGESVLITFDPHPRRVLYPQTDGKLLFLLNSQKEKIQLLEDAGLDNLFIINFTKEFSELSSVDFIRNIIVGKLHASKVVIGFNHHFGHNREGDYQHLYELGKYYHFQVEEIPEHVIKNETVSSTRIRKALTAGDIQKANAYLDHYFRISGKLTNGSKTCMDLHYTTYRLNLEGEGKLIPSFGVYYAVKCNFDNYSCKAILNVKNSVKADEAAALEICLLNDKSDDMTGRECRIFFAKRLRDEKSFNDDNAFSIQLKKDLKNIDELIY
jgi:riboflavin kinase/FMN adenylyltransferase